MTINYTALTSLTGATANAAASSMMDNLKTMITANAAWTVVDDSIVGSASNRWLCFKNAAASSGLTNDYYVLFVYNATTSISVYVGESYNTTTHVLSNAVPALSSTSLALSSTGQFASSPTATPSATGAATLSGTVAPFTVAMAPATTTIFYQCVVYPDHFVFGMGGTNSITTASLYVGGYQTLISGGEQYPIVLANVLITSTTASAVSASREIPAYFSTTKTYNMGIAPFTGAAALNVEYSRASQAAIDAGQSNTFPTSNVMLLGNQGGSGSFFATRGRFFNIVTSAALPTSMVAGDTVQIGSTYWALIPSGGNYYYVNTGVSAP